MPEKIEVGSMRQLSAYFYSDAAGLTLFDPTVVKLYIRKGPNAATQIIMEYGVDPEIVKDAVGKYHCQVSIDVSGYWYYGWAAEGTLEEYKEESFYVEVPRAR